VLVTCSIGYQRDERLAAAAVDALRDEPLRLLVTLAGADGAGRLPQHAANLRVERFVPHAPILERALAVVCHGGMGIVQKALAARVPVVALRFGRDQPEIAQRAAHACAGVEEAAPPRLRRAVETAISLRPGLDALAFRLDASGGAARFADAADELVS
jgi:UDP:flavonoid glycosyltransferase YjiC (YdhE family)